MSTQRFIFSYLEAKSFRAAVSASLSPVVRRALVSTPRILARAGSSPFPAARARAEPAAAGDWNLGCASLASAVFLVFNCTIAIARTASAIAATRAMCFQLLFFFPLDSISISLELGFDLVLSLNFFTDGVRHHRKSGAAPVRASGPCAVVGDVRPYCRVRDCFLRV